MLERTCRRRLEKLSAAVRKAYQKDTGGGGDADAKSGLDSVVQQHFQVAEEAEASMSRFEDALGGVASFTLRNSFLRIRVALDGAAAKLDKNRRICGWHRSEKIVETAIELRPADIDIESDVDDVGRIPFYG